MTMRIVSVTLGFLAYFACACSGESWSFVAPPTPGVSTDASFFASPGFTEYGGMSKEVEIANGLAGLVVTTTSTSAGIVLDPPQPSLTSQSWFVQTKIKVIHTTVHPNSSPVAGVAVQDQSASGQKRHWMVTIGSDGRLCGPDLYCPLDTNVGDTTDDFHDLKMTFDRATDQMAVWWDGEFQFAGTTTLTGNYVPGKVSIGPFSSFSNSFKFLVHSITASNVLPSATAQEAQKAFDALTPELQTSFRADNNCASSSVGSEASVADWCSLRY